MRLPDDATLYIRIWTGQKCKACGSQFKYLRRFTVPRNQTEYSATQAGIEKLYVDAARTTSEVVFPCPHCGYIQPDMIGTRKAVIHGMLSFAVFFLLLVGTMTAAFGFLAPEAAGILSASIAGMALLVHIYQIAADPNRNRLANLALAQSQVLNGTLALLKIEETDLAPVIRKPIRSYLAASGILVLAIGVFLLPTIFDLPSWVCQVAGIVLFIWSGSTFANAALRMKEHAPPREVIELNTTQVLDDSVPEDFRKKKALKT